MFDEIEGIILACIIFDEKREYVNLKELDESLFQNKELFRKCYKWREENKPYDCILMPDVFTREENAILFLGTSRMVSICNYPHYLNRFKRDVLEYRISLQLETGEIDPNTLRQYIEVVNNVQTKEKIYNYEGDIHDYLERFQERAVGKFERFSLNMQGFDEALGYIRPKRFYTIGASSGVGKTNLMLKIQLEQMAKDVPCLFFTAEMDYDSLVERMGAINSGLRLFDILNAHLKPEQIKDYSDSIQKHLYGKKSFIFETPVFNLEKIKTLIDKTGVKFIFVDYLQKFSLEGSKGQTPAFVMNSIANGLKAAAMDKNVVIFAGCQLGAHADRQNPKSGDLKESGGILEASDGLILIGEMSETPEYKQLRMHIAKNKYGIQDKFVYAMNRKTCDMQYSYVDTQALKD